MPEGNRSSVNWRNVAIALAVVLICSAVAVYATRYRKPYPKRPPTTLVKKPIQKPAKAKMYRKNHRPKKNECACDTMIILIQ